MLRLFRVACCTSQLLGDAHSMRLHETGAGARDDSEGVDDELAMVSVVARAE
jgi:hypothetical protein